MLIRIVAALALIWSALLGTAHAQGLDPQNTLLMDLPAGRVVIKLRPDLAPKTVAQMKKLAGRHFFDGTPFHRVIPGFMAQGGDPTGTGTGGSYEKNLPAEFSQAPFKRGTVAMARTQDPNSANSQFFICFTDDGCSSLTGKYTIWGEVVKGMEFVDKLKAGDEANNGQVDRPDKILKLKLMTDTSAN